MNKFKKRLKKILLKNEILFLSVLKTYAFFNNFIKVSKENDKIIIQKDKKIIKISYPNKVYAFSIIKEFDYFSSSVEGIFDNGRSLFDFSEPKFHKIPKINEEFFYTSLPEGLETNDTYLKHLNLKEGDIILDLGAYCGLATYEFSKIVGDEGLVISIEPDVSNYSALTKNVENLKMKNVRTLNCAIWNSDTELSFNSERSMGSAVSGCIARDTDTISVQAYSLNSIAVKFNLKKINAIKIDIEGSEYPVFLNIENLLEQFKPKLILEIHQNHLGLIDAKYFQKKLEKAGYRVLMVNQSEKETFPLLYAEYMN